MVAFLGIRHGRLAFAATTHFSDRERLEGRRVARHGTRRVFVHAASLTSNVACLAGHDVVAAISLLLSAGPLPAIYNSSVRANSGHGPVGIAGTARAAALD